MVPLYGVFHIQDADARVPDGFLPERQVWFQVYGFCEINMTLAEVTIPRPPFRIFQFGDHEHDNRLVLYYFLQTIGNDEPWIVNVRVILCQSVRRKGVIACCFWIVFHGVVTRELMVEVRG